MEGKHEKEWRIQACPSWALVPPWDFGSSGPYTHPVPGRNPGVRSQSETTWILGG